MDYKSYFERQDVRKQIEKLKKKYKDKQIVLYGAGMFAQELISQYDVSGLNIVGISDRSFQQVTNDTFLGYKKYVPWQLNDIKYDVILLSVYNTLPVWDYLRYEVLTCSEKSNVEIKPLINETFISIIKSFFTK